LASSFFERKVPLVRRFLIPLFALALVMSACSSGGGPDASENPKGALTSAFDRLNESEGQTMVLSIRSDEASLSALSEGELTEENASTILDSSVTISSTNVEDPKDVEFEMVIDIAGELIEAKQVEEVLYIRVDGRELIEKYGSEADIEAGLAEMPPQFEWLNVLVDGEWVALTGAQALQEQFGMPSPDAETQNKLTSDLTAAIEANSEVRSEGAEDAGDHLVATVQVRPLFESLTEAFGDLGALTGVPGAQLPPATEIPDEQVDIHFWVEDGDLTQIELDITQFADWEDAEEFPEGVEELALRLELEGFDGGVEAPDAAEEVDIMQLFQTFFQGMTGGESAGSAEIAPPEGQSTLEDLCKSLKDAPPEVVEQFAAECPELQQ
jgi:hypothetical protein